MHKCASYQSSSNQGIPVSNNKIVTNIIMYKNFVKIRLVMMMAFWLKLEELLLPLKLTSNPQCPMFKYLTAIPLWELRSASRELAISSTILAEVFKLLVLN